MLETAERMLRLWEVPLEVAPWLGELSDAQIARLMRTKLDLFKRLRWSGEGVRVRPWMKSLVSLLAAVPVFELGSASLAMLDGIVLHDDAVPDDGRSEEGLVVVGRADGHRRQIHVSWDAVWEGALDPYDGQNVVFHEVAHVVDHGGRLTRFGSTVGDADPARFISALGAAWLAHRREELAPDVVPPYGRRNPAEMFAVASEVFFENPWDLEVTVPHLYDVMCSVYRRDPAHELARPQQHEPPTTGRRPRTVRTYKRDGRFEDRASMRARTGSTFSREEPRR